MRHLVAQLQGDAQRLAALGVQELGHVVARLEQHPVGGDLGDEAELDATGKIYYQRDQLLKQAEKVKDPKGRETWLRIAALYRELAKNS